MPMTETLRSTYSRSERHSCHCLIEPTEALELAEGPNRTSILDTIA